MHQKVIVDVEKKHYASVQEWRKAGAELFGTDMRDWKFMCPECGNIQCYWDFIAGCLSKAIAREHAYLTCLSRFKNKPDALLAHLQECGYSGTGRANLGDTITIELNQVTGTMPVLPFCIPT